VTVHIDEVTSEVVAEAEPALPSTPAEGWTWQEMERLRAMRGQLERDQARTRAEGFGD
jgi:hypothetical protein